MSARVRVRLLFADDGDFHHETVSIPRDSLGNHERLIDCLREDPAVLKDLWLDVERLAAAWLVEDDG